MLVFLTAFAGLASLSNAQAVPPSGCTLKSPAPSGDICGLAGHTPVYLYKHRYYRQYKQRLPNLTQCRDLCLRRHNGTYGPSCSNFRFDHITSTCYYTSNPLLSVTADPASNLAYYNRTCFDCPSNCPPVTGVNLFDNAGFELSPRLLAPWKARAGNTAGKIVKGGAYGNSSRSYECGVNSINCGFAVSVVTCPGVIYEFSFDYRAAPRGADAYHAQIQIDDAFAFINIVSGGIAKVWHTYTNLMTFDQTNNGLDYFPFLADSPAILQADNFKLVPTTFKYDTIAGAMNVLQNSGFESGIIAPWGVPYDKANASIVSPGIRSSHAFQFNYAPGDSNGDLVLFQNLTYSGGKIVPGTPYLLSFDFVSNFPGFGMYVDLGVGPEQTQLIAGHNTTYIIQSNQQLFIGQSGTAQMPMMGQEDATYVQLAFYLHGITPANGGSLLLDNFAIRELASPPDKISVS